MNGFQAQATRPAEPRMYRVVAERIQELIREQQMEPGASPACLPHFAERSTVV